MWYARINVDLKQLSITVAVANSRKYKINVCLSFLNRLRRSWIWLEQVFKRLKRSRKHQAQVKPSSFCFASHSIHIWQDHSLVGWSEVTFCVRDSLNYEPTMRTTASGAAFKHSFQWELSCGSERQERTEQIFDSLTEYQEGNSPIFISCLWFRSIPVDLELIACFVKCPLGSEASWRQLGIFE